MHKPQKMLSVIAARGGSKGILRKNLVDIAGIPLVAHMIGHALNVRYEMEVVVSTEDKEIRETSINYGAKAPFVRPAELAEDNITSLPVVQHAVLEMEKMNGVTYDLIVYLQPTAPLCRPQDIEACIKKLINEPDLESAVTITEVETHPLRMKRLIDGERVINYIDQGFEDMRPRQLLPKAYRRAGSVYASRREVVMKKNTLVGDYCKGVIVPDYTAIDIDNYLDLELVRIIYARNNRKREDNENEC